MPKEDHYMSELNKIVKQLLIEPKGILAADESTAASQNFQIPISNFQLI